MEDIRTALLLRVCCRMINISLSPSTRGASEDEVRTLFAISGAMAVVLASTMSLSPAPGGDTAELQEQHPITTTVRPGEGIESTDDELVSGPDSDEVEALAAKMLRAQGQLAVGESIVVDHAHGSIQLTMTKTGLAISPVGTVIGGVGGSSFGTQGWCHSAAMAAVYTIGAAAFAAAALVGGITVFGVFIPAYAASAMSIALSAGAGLSALVSLYIC